MTDKQEELRLILEKYIGGVYRQALESTGKSDIARDVTRRVMALLRRTHETGLSVTDDTVKRLTEDCCEEMAYYQEQRAIFRDGVIAGAPDFETALSSLSEEELRRAREKARAEASRLRAEQEETRQREAERQNELAAMQQGEQAQLSEAERRRAEIERKRAELDALLAADSSAAIETPQAPVSRQEWQEEHQEKTPEDREYRGEEDDEPVIAGRKGSAFPIIVLSVVSVVLMLLVFCLVMMLMHRGVLPGGQSRFVQQFAQWFNASLFQLF